MDSLKYVESSVTEYPHCCKESKNNCGYSNGRKDSGGRTTFHLVDNIKIEVRYSQKMEGKTTLTGRTTDDDHHHDDRFAPVNGKLDGVHN